jgi:dephospho-CoA kinase
MLRVALTGSIAVGKSFVLRVFAELGCHTIEADQVAREVVEPCRPAYHEIIREFGAEVLMKEGRIDRARLGSIVFNNAAKREQLNRIVHPRVLEEIDCRIRELQTSDPDGIIVVSAALIVEAAVRKDFDKLIVVYCDEERQIERLVDRDGLSRQEAIRRIAAQLSSDEKRRHADFEINTTGSFEETRAQVETVYRRLIVHISTPC